VVLAEPPPTIDGASPGGSPIRDRSSSEGAGPKARAFFFAPSLPDFPEAPMTKRALKRMVREGEFSTAEFADAKIRRLPVERGWSPMPEEREQGYLKTIKPKSAGQAALMEAIDQKNLVLALGPAGTGKTYLAIAKAVEALEAGSASCCRARRSRPASRSAICPATWRRS
jgi:hypothetical protein